jgi:glutaredoxin
MLKLYTKPKCFYCRELKKKLKEWGYKYIDINLENDPRCEQFMLDKGHTTFPQLYYEGVDMMQGSSTELSQAILRERMDAEE